MTHEWTPLVQNVEIESLIAAMDMLGKVCFENDTHSLEDQPARNAKFSIAIIQKLQTAEKELRRTSITQRLVL